MICTVRDVRAKWKLAALLIGATIAAVSFRTASPAAIGGAADAGFRPRRMQE
jgi:hypothetical protein